MKNNTNNAAIPTTNVLSLAKDNIFDKFILLNLAAEIGSDTLIPDLSEIFFRNLPDTLKAIEQARSTKGHIQQDNEALRQCFHSLKGNAATLGLVELKEVCEGLEHNFRTSSNPTFTQEDFDSLISVSERARQALQDFQKNL